MVVYDLIEFSKVLRKRLLTARTDDIAKEIAIEIKCATHPDGKLLTVLEKDKVIKYIKYNPVTMGQVVSYCRKQITLNFLNWLLSSIVS